MKYSSGEVVRVGDKVRLGSQEVGTVVCSFDSGDYANNFPEKDWGYLKKGVMINFPLIGLIHCEDSDEDLELVKAEK